MEVIPIRSSRKKRRILLDSAVMEIPGRTNQLEVVEFPKSYHVYYKRVKDGVFLQGLGYATIPKEKYETLMNYINRLRK